MKPENVTRAVKSVPEFDADLAKISVRGQWQYDAMLEKLMGAPNTAGLPYLWRWKLIYEKLLDACDVRH